MPVPLRATARRISCFLFALCTAIVGLVAVAAAPANAAAGGPIALTENIAKCLDLDVASEPFRVTSCGVG